MMKKALLLLFALWVLTGCWDERLLKDHTLILSIGYDREEEGLLRQTVTFPAESNVGGGDSEITTDYNHITVTGPTTKDTDIKMDRYAPETFDRSKARIVLFGEELAEEGVFVTLDSIYRDLRGPLNAVMAVVGGKAEKALITKNKYDMLLSEFYLDLLESASKVGLTKAENIQDICPFILTKGKDVAVPYIELEDEGKVADVMGLALFTNDKMTGKLLGKDASIYLILANEAPKRTKVNLKIAEGEKEPEKNYVDFAIRKMKRKMDVDVKDEQVHVTLQYELLVEIDEFAKDELEKHARAMELEEEIASILEAKSKEVIDLIQDLNHDGFGIGQEVKAYHHKAWEQMDWMEEYPDIDMEAKMKVKILTHGIMN